MSETLAQAELVARTEPCLYGARSFEQLGRAASAARPNLSLTGTAARTEDPLTDGAGQRRLNRSPGGARSATAQRSETAYRGFTGRRPGTPVFTPAPRPAGLAKAAYRQPPVRLGQPRFLLNPSRSESSSASRTPPDRVPSKPRVTGTLESSSHCVEIVLCLPREVPEPGDTRPVGWFQPGRVRYPGSQRASAPNSSGPSSTASRPTGSEPRCAPRRVHPERPAW